MCVYVGECVVWWGCVDLVVMVVVSIVVSVVVVLVVIVVVLLIYLCSKWALIDIRLD